MSLLRTAIRWILLLGFTGLGLLYLQGAAYRAWIAGETLSEDSSGWFFSAWNFFAWSLAAILAGIGLFILLRFTRPVRKRTFIILALSFGLAIFPLVREFIAADNCLDGGGKWSATELRCKRI